MPLLKSLFVPAYMMFALAAAVFAAWQAWRTGQWLAWGGLLLATVPFSALIGRLMLFKNRARTSGVLVGPLVLGAAGLGLAWLGGAAAGRQPLALTALAWVGLIVYDFWYSRLGRQPSAALRPGQPLPGFSLRDVAGATVAAASLTDRPVIWLFYRGNWCPICMAQIKELVARRAAYAAAGVRVALISPQPHRCTVALARAHDGGFDFLTDEGNAAARQLGLAAPFGVPAGMQLLGYSSETVWPTVILTAPGGRILWTHETDNYRVRPEPDVFLEVLRQHAAPPAA